MQPEKTGPGSPAHWLRHARSDLALAQVARPDDTLLEALCFHAQQAAEKALKALLVQEGLDIPRTHSIRALLDLLPPEIDAPDGVVEAAELTEYAVEARYPGALESVSEQEHVRAVALAQAVVRWVEERIPSASDHGA